MIPRKRKQVKVDVSQPVSTVTSPEEDAAKLLIMKRQQRLQAATNEINAVAAKHGVALLAVCTIKGNQIASGVEVVESQPQQ